MKKAMLYTFPDWSFGWKALKKRKGHPTDIEAVLAQWSHTPPSHTRGRKFPKLTGSRKNYKIARGEQLIESQLLGEKGAKGRFHAISGSSVKNLGVYAIFNNFAAAKIKRGDNGQIIADAFGILRVGKSFHPISIEVKVTDSNCWSAVVQNLQQVRFFRSAGENFRKELSRYGADFVPEGTNLSGAWGLVLAPPEYWRKDKRLDEALGLLSALSEKTAGGRSRTEARILLAAIDESGIRLVGGHKLPASNSL